MDILEPIELNALQMMLTMFNMLNSFGSSFCTWALNKSISLLINVRSMFISVLVTSNLKAHRLATSFNVKWKQCQRRQGTGFLHCSLRIIIISIQLAAANLRFLSLSTHAMVFCDLYETNNFKDIQYTGLTIDLSSNIWAIIKGLAAEKCYLNARRSVLHSFSIYYAKLPFTSKSKDQKQKLIQRKVVCKMPRSNSIIKEISRDLVSLPSVQHIPLSR